MRWECDERAVVNRPFFSPMFHVLLAFGIEGNGLSPATLLLLAKNADPDSECGVTSDLLFILYFAKSVE